MKVLIAQILTLLMLVGSPAYGSWWVRLGGAEVASGCSAASEEVNANRDTVYTNQHSAAAGGSHLFRVQASCTGSLNTSYLYTDNTDADYKVCVYNSTDTAPVTGTTADGLIGCSTSMTESTGAAAFQDDGGGITGNVVSGSWYWIAVFNDDDSPNSLQVFGNDEADSIYYGTTNYYDSPPATLNGTDITNSIGWGPYSVYVTIGD